MGSALATDSSLWDCRRSFDSLAFSKESLSKASLSGGSKSRKKVSVGGPAPTAIVVDCLIIYHVGIRIGFRSILQ